MHPETDYNLIALAAGVAILAGYTGLQFLERIVLQPGDRIFWILGGAVALGTGIWAIHFMALEMWPIAREMTYDLPLTIFAWLATTAICALALNNLALGRPTAIRYMVSGLILGVAVWTMQYSGISAMRILPSPDYAAGPLLVGFTLAAAGTAAAWWLASRHRPSSTLASFAVRLVAAAVMAGSVLAAFALGIGSLTVNPDAVSLTGFGLEAGWPLLPLIVAAAVLAAVALVLGHLGLPRAGQSESIDANGEIPSADSLLASQGIDGRGELNRRLRTAAENGERITVVIFKMIRIKPWGRQSARSSDTPHRLSILGGQLVRAVPDMKVTYLDEDTLAVAAPGKDGRTTLGTLRQALPWLRRCEELEIDLRLGHAEYPRECRQIYQLVPRASACLAPWPGPASAPAPEALGELGSS